MDVLLSVKPCFAELILNGTKKYEYRRTIFSRADVQKVIVYASSPVKKIVGEFQIDEIIWDKPESIWLRTCTSAGISRDLFSQYFIGKDKGYAISIKHNLKYTVPIDPWNILPNFTPPQSFMYIDSDILLSSIKSTQCTDLPLKRVPLIKLELEDAGDALIFVPV